MSTRANIIVRDEADELIFYRHSDGYPDGTLPSLNQFLDLVKQGQVRDNTGQASGWLILLGADEYGVSVREGQMAPNNLGAGMQWKVGAYEPTTDLHGDIEFLYVVDLETKRIRHRKVSVTVPAIRQFPDASTAVALIRRKSTVANRATRGTQTIM
jgi:hypothetical protein